MQRDEAEILAPSSEEEAAALVAEAAAARTPLSIRGGGTRSGLGRPAGNAKILSTARLSGITLMEPSELVVSARAGTPLAEVEARLAGHGLMLPFEPMDHRPLYRTVGEPTIGAVAACNLSGPRRIVLGAARDHLIGVRFVNGRGEVVKSGGRVMKNVTGLDLVKLQAGAHGTLGLLTEVTFKLLPRPEAMATLAFPGLDDRRAVALMSAALGSPFEVSAAAHLPAFDGAPARTFLRLEGLAPVVADRAGRLAGHLADFGRPERISGQEAEGLWRAIRDAEPLAEPREAEVWRVSVAPGTGPAVVEGVGRVPGLKHLYDWGGGLVWLSLPPATAADVHALAARLGGHAVLVRASEARRLAGPVFQPQPARLAELERGIRASFDPEAILNPGRMAGNP